MFCVDIFFGQHIHYKYTINNSPTLDISALTKPLHKFETLYSKLILGCKVCAVKTPWMDRGKLTPYASL